ncbi:MAG TPA: hypothetical protein DCZ91_25475 [Lachnospiraceae bacterium]|nr:hypothetical protein [Lachnospiraceae bacterium]
MEMNYFADRICKAVGKELGKDYEVKVQQVRKNNGICRTGLLVLEKDGNTAPTVYLESFYEAYKNGMPVGRIAGSIVRIYRENPVKGNIDLEFFRDFGKLQDRICYRLVGKKGNETLLEGIPHTDYLDLAICFFYAYYSDRVGEGSILIHNSHMEMWHTCTEELFRLARVNTPVLFPWKYGTLWEIVREDIQAGQEEDGEEAALQASVPDVIPMRILTNSKRNYGAACILYPGVLEEVAQRMGGSFYILPSSVHEVIFMPHDRMRPEEALKEMIYDINRSQVEPEEVLSDSLYYYDAEMKETRLL